jgi:hypothetical protein
MKKALVGAVLLLSVSISLGVGAARTQAQGPAGAGSVGVAQDASHSMNPLNWLKRDSKDSDDEIRTRGDVEKKLTPRLQAAGILPNATLTDTCSSFAILEGCLAALHASHNVGIDFNCVRANVTGVHTNADVSQCKVADGEKTQSLSKTIHQLKPDANAGQAAKEADQQALEDLKSIGI